MKPCVAQAIENAVRMPCHAWKFIRRIKIGREEGRGGRKQVRGARVPTENKECEVLFCQYLGGDAQERGGREN